MSKSLVVMGTTKWTNKPGLKSQISYLRQNCAKYRNSLHPYLLSYKLSISNSRTPGRAELGWRKRPRKALDPRLVHTSFSAPTAALTSYHWRVSLWRLIITTCVELMLIAWFSRKNKRKKKGKKYRWELNLNNQQNLTWFPLEAGQCNGSLWIEARDVSFQCLWMDVALNLPTNTYGERENFS